LPGAALVTGAGRRIGRALAIALAGAGWDVVLHHRASAAEAEETAAQVRALGRRAALVARDLADLSAPDALVTQAAEALGPLSLLVNCASRFEDDRLGELTPEGLEAHLAINLKAPILLSQAFARQAPDGAAVVNVIDQRVLHLNPQFFSYTLSKAALWTATQTMAQALAPRIRVNAVAPGPVLPSVHQTAEAFEAEAANVPLQRRALPEEIAGAVLYLAAASSVTGQMIAVDGGQHLAWRTPDIVSP
jgi:NAD(P)-dependent dehydrogenase (short-subunit alcohol dehydrogenase family)